jgi:hypothetical protein
MAGGISDLVKRPLYVNSYIDVCALSVQDLR